MEDYVILVDEKNNETGTEEKIKAHKEGKLHRAFSIFIFNSKGEMLLQKRANIKYHCGGLWSNACCSHPNSNENTEEAAHRRLKEEMGFDCELEEKFKFIYKEPFSNGLTEYELDHVFIGTFSGKPVINKKEIEEHKWVNQGDLRKDIKRNPQDYTPWFRIILGKLD